jgi:hypothetical protein
LFGGWLLSRDISFQLSRKLFLSLAHSPAYRDKTSWCYFGVYEKGCDCEPVKHDDPQTSVSSLGYQLDLIPGTLRKNVSLVEKSRRPSVERSFFAECPCKAYLFVLSQKGRVQVSASYMVDRRLKRFHELLLDAVGDKTLGEVQH